MYKRQDLDTCRPIGMATGAIPFFEIVRWTDRYCVSQSQADEVLIVVKAMDRVYLEYQDKKSTSEGNSGKPPRPAQGTGQNT